MFDVRELKRTVEITKPTVECPVINCKTKSKKITKRTLKLLDSYLGKRVFVNSKEFEDYFCKRHQIYITPSTFIYKNFKDNLLWKNDHLIDKIIKVKRTKAQLYHDNSEDAVTWNVFRFLERNGLLCGFLSGISKTRVANSEVIYWSYSQSQQKTWDELRKARIEFGEVPKRSSEPDIIIKYDNVLFFIEAKLTATNETTPSNPNDSKRYLTGGGNWYENVFKSDYQTIAISERKYELLRFWLIGSWIARCLNLKYYLVNLVLSERERNIEETFKRHIKENQYRKFIRITWEEIYEYILRNVENNKDKNIALNYFRNKSIGYKNGYLQKAFNL